jgi:Tfp pilus assembly PilM family ATPase
VITEEQVMENVKHEITSYLLIKQEEYSIDYKMLEYIQPQEGQARKLRIMVAAVPDGLLQSYVDAL